MDAKKNDCRSLIEDRRQIRILKRDRGRPAHFFFFSNVPRPPVLTNLRIFLVESALRAASPYRGLVRCPARQWHSPARLFAPRIFERHAAIEDGFFARLMLNLIGHEISNTLKLTGKASL